MSAVKCALSLGRPRCFDIEEALQKALEVFWLKGYEGASLTDLTKAMGINKPSLYATFGNKEQLFLKAIDVYENRPCAFMHPAMEQPTAYEVVKHMLHGAAESFTNRDHPEGCIVVQSALGCTEASASVRNALIQRRKESELELCERLVKAKEDGDLPENADPRLLARYIGTVIQGLSIQATNGASTDELKQVADMTLASWPR